jgi:hypothetical protein
MFTTTVETHPNVLSAAAVIRDPIVNRAGKNLGYAESLIQKEAPSLHAESNKDLCRRFIQKILNEGELSLIREFMSPDVVNHELADALGGSEPPQGHNIKWMAGLVHLYRHAFPDLNFEMRGTQKNALMTIAASGRKLDIASIRVDRMASGRIVESWFHFDALGMLRQLDALPPLNRRRPRQVAPISQETAPGSRLPAPGWNPALALPQAALAS